MTQGHVWCRLPGSGSPPGMLTHGPAPRAVLWFQGRALAFPGVASQAHQLLGQATYLNPGRKALTITGLPQVKTAHSESQDRQSSGPRCLPHANPGAWPHSLTVLSKEGLRERQPTCGSSRGWRNLCDLTLHSNFKGHSGEEPTLI